MLRFDIKDCLQGYHEMQILTDKFNNKENVYKTFFNILDNEHVITIVKNQKKFNHLSKSKQTYITSIYINESTKQIRCLNMIKTPYQIDGYNYVISRLINKIKSIDAVDVYVKNKSNIDYLCNDYDKNYVIKQIEAVFTDDDNNKICEKVITFLSIVNLYNETVYDKLKDEFIKKQTKKIREEEMKWKTK